MASALLLLACEAALPPPPPATPPPQIAPEPLLPPAQHTLPVTRSGTRLSVGGHTCPGDTPTWAVGDITFLCIDPGQMDVAGAEALIAAAAGSLRVALYPGPELPWPLWFFGAEVTLMPADAPLRDEAGGALRHGVTQTSTLTRAAGWTHIGGGWLRDDLPLGDSLLLVPRHAESRTFALDHPEIIWKLAAEVADGDGTATLNGGSLTETPPIPISGGYTLYNPSTALLRVGENRIEGPRDVGLSGHIGEAVLLNWRSGPPGAGWQELRFDAVGWSDGDGGRHRRARLEAPEAVLGVQVWLDGPGRVWLNGVEVLHVETAGRGQIPPAAWMAGGNLLAVEAAPGVSAVLRRY